MKKRILSVGILMVALAMVTSCGNSDSKKTETKSKNATPAAVTGSQPGAGLNIRFINIDTIGLKYNLAIDFNEQMIRLQNNLAEEEKKQRNSLQASATSLQNKMKAAQSEAEASALQGEYDNLQKMQSNAEQKLSQMGADMEKTLTNNAKTLQDSLSNFLRDYAAEKGYDAILVNTAAPYYSPALDITDEVLEGLNNRYNKVKK